MRLEQQNHLASEHAASSTSSCSYCDNDSDDDDAMSAAPSAPADCAIIKQQQMMINNLNGTIQKLMRRLRGEIATSAACFSRTQAELSTTSRRRSR